jgi:hypothetical protein
MIVGPIPGRIQKLFGLLRTGAIQRTPSSRIGFRRVASWCGGASHPSNRWAGRAPGSGHTPPLSKTYRHTVTDEGCLLVHDPELRPTLAITWFAVRLSSSVGQSYKAFYVKT